MEQDQDFHEGWAYGAFVAEHHYRMWQDQEGPPFPWPKNIRELSVFVDECTRIAMYAIARSMYDEARRRGLDPECYSVPRAFVRGREEGYRSRLAELVQNGKLAQPSYW